MSEFHAAMKAAHVSALWEVGIHANTPPERSYIWRWKTMDPLLDAAVHATSMGNAERRVLMLNNPMPNGEDAESAIPNLCVNLQVLMPGERARPHRHTMHALRFVLEGEGVTTVVEGLLSSPAAGTRPFVILLGQLWPAFWAVGTAVTFWWVSRSLLRAAERHIAAHDRIPTGRLRLIDLDLPPVQRRAAHAGHAAAHPHRAIGPERPFGEDPLR